MERTTQTTCGYCGVGCTLDVHTRGDGVVAISPAQGPVNRGHACVKGRFAHGFVRARDRLTTPLVRRDGRLEEGTWSEALGVIRDRLTRIRAEHGSDAVAGISSSRATNEENYLFQKLLRVGIGTNNVDNCSRLCHSPSGAGLTAAFGLSGGTNTADDIERADCFLLAGTNTDGGPPGRRRPHQAGGAARCAAWWWSTPGGSSWRPTPTSTSPAGPAPTSPSSTAWPTCCWPRDCVDKAFLAERADGFDELSALLAAYAPARVEELSGVPADDLVARRRGCTAAPSARRSSTGSASPSTRTAPTGCAPWRTSRS